MLAALPDWLAHFLPTPGGMSKRVFITGGTGFIGSKLVRALERRGDVPIVLTRDRSSAHERLGDRVHVVVGDPMRAGPWYRNLAHTDAVVNLAGAPINGKRWTEDYMHEVRSSRVDTTRALVSHIAGLHPDHRPQVLVSASAVDYYPFAETLARNPGWDADEEITEEGPTGDTFLAKVCDEWEEEALGAREHEVRVVLMRTGFVLGDSGALPLIARAFRYYLGGPLGSGKQWFSWIHIDDVVHAYLHAIDDQRLSGPINAVAPNPVRNQEFARALGHVLQRPSWLPAPEVALRVALGPMATYLVHGRRAVPTALTDEGFDFAYPDLDDALAAAVTSR